MSRCQGDSSTQSWDPFLGPQKWNIAEMVKLYPAKGSYNSSNNLVPLYWCAVWPKEEPTESVRDMALAYTSLQPIQREELVLKAVVTYCIAFG